jgi:ribosome recycling factor
VRNARRDANESIKKLLKDKDISEDDEKRGEKEIQELTDDYVARIDKVIADKEKELLEI